MAGRDSTIENVYQGRRATLEAVRATSTGTAHTWYDDNEGVNTVKHPATPETGPMPPMAQPSNEGSVDTATLDLLASWRLEDATANPEEIRAAELELTEFKRAMNDSRAQAGEPVLYP